MIETLSQELVDGIDPRSEVRPLLLVPNDNSKSRSAPYLPLPRLKEVKLVVGFLQNNTGGGFEPHGASDVRIRDGLGKIITRKLELSESVEGVCICVSKM